MSEVAQLANCHPSKIENWYKHYRRTQAKQGNMKLKTKKYFKKDELSFLSDLFDQNTNPTTLQLREIADKLNCNLSQIKSWFSNRRKKFKKIQMKNILEQVPITDATCDSQFIPSSYSNKPQYFSTFSLTQNMISTTANFDAILPTSSKFNSVQQMPLIQNVSTEYSVNRNQYITIDPSEKATANYENIHSFHKPISELIPYLSPRLKINRHIGLQNNTVSPKIVNFPMVNNSTINSLLPSMPSLICSNQPNAGLNEPTQQQIIVQNIPVSYIAFVPVSNIPFLNYPLQNNGLYC